MASERSEDATKGPRPSKSRSFHWTSGLSIIECSHGYDAQTKFKFIVHVDISDERMGKAAGRVFRERHKSGGSLPTLNKRTVESRRLAKPLSPEAGPVTPIAHARWNFT